MSRMGQILRVLWPNVRNLWTTESSDVKEVSKETWLSGKKGPGGTLKLSLLAKTRHLVVHEAYVWSDHVIIHVTAVQTCDAHSRSGDPNLFILLTALQKYERGANIKDISSKYWLRCQSFSKRNCQNLSLRVVISCSIALPLKIGPNVYETLG